MSSILHKIQEKDSAIINKAIRSHSKLLSISLDGKSIIRNEVLPNFEKSISRTIYVENLPNKCTSDDIINKFNKIQQKFRGENEGIAESVIECVYVPSKTDFKYCLVEYKKKKLMKANFLYNFELDTETTWNNANIMKMEEWLKRMKEYEVLLHERKLLLEEAINPKLKKRKYPKMERGCIVKFFGGIHPKTNRLTLKKLFSVAGEVCFVDYKSGENEGLLRYKSSHAAKLSLSYFENKKIKQISDADTCLKLNLDYEPYTTKCSFEKEDYIKLQLVEDEEEKDYWKMIKQERKKKKEEERLENDRMRIEEGKEEQLRKKSHVVFADDFEDNF